ncbi:GNAT family N-acetyltransferase [Streptomyces phaeochromogenes]|uniref:GNAT family N-acetyltransferase n=1 Tax=Streptomyces phaeochromogenes TaxID=1923 RepID=UPI00367511BC
MARSSGPVLRTQRLVMEPIRREDSDDLFESVVSQDSVMRWLATGRADSRSAAEAMCDDHVAHWTRHASPLTTMIYDLADLPHPGISVELRGLPF